MGAFWKSKSLQGSMSGWIYIEGSSPEHQWEKYERYFPWWVWSGKEKEPRLISPIYKISTHELCRSRFPEISSSAKTLTRCCGTTFERNGLAHRKQFAEHSASQYPEPPQVEIHTNNVMFGLWKWIIQWGDIARRPQRKLKTWRPKVLELTARYFGVHRRETFRVKTWLLIMNKWR